MFMRHCIFRKQTSLRFYWSGYVEHHGRSVATRGMHIQCGQCPQYDPAGIINAVFIYHANVSKEATLPDLTIGETE
jgi:hypothetical protein